MVQLIRAAALAVVALAASTGAMPIRGANGVLYGISQSSPCGTPPTSCNSLVSIDEDSGVQTPIGQKFPGLDAQELSTIDSKRNIYYGIFLNMTTKAPTVVGLAIGSGNVVLVRELQLSEMVFVGVGQHIQCDPGSGFLIISGADGKTGHKVMLVLMLVLALVLVLLLVMMLVLTLVLMLQGGAAGPGDAGARRRRDLPRDGAGHRHPRRRRHLRHRPRRLLLRRT